MKISAMATRQRGGPLASWTYDSPALGPFDCLLKVQACGLCYSDIHMIDNDWQISRYPLVPGHEVVGEVVERGTQVSHLKVGNRVGVGWQRSSCLQCRDCLSGNENLCRESRGIITDGYGGFADYLLTDSRFCFPLPAGLPTDSAGPLLCGGITVFAALRYAGMTSGQDIGVIGLGGLGHLAVRYAAKLGNRVTVFTTSQEKTEDAIRLGAAQALLTPKGVLPQKAAKLFQERFDIIISTVAANLDWEGYLPLLRSDGTLTFVGVASKPLTLSLEHLLSKRRRIMASPIAGRALITEALGLADRLGITPVVETFPLADAQAAIEQVRKNRVRYRAVLLPEASRTTTRKRKQ